MGNIWFDDSFDFRIFARETLDYNASRLFIQPKRTITGNHGAFYIDYLPINQELNSIDFFYDLMEAVSKERSAESNPTYQYLLDGNVLIYEFNFNMSPSHFDSHFSGRGFRNLPDFDSIYVKPIYGASLNVYFEGEASRVFTIKDTHLYNSFYDHFQNLEGMVHNSSSLLDLSTGRNIFFPAHRTQYSPLLAHTSYYSFGDLTLAALEVSIGEFFENPESVVASTDATMRYSFTDNNSIVKYFEDDILDYANYRLNRAASGSSLIDDFALALSFIENDNMMRNKIYLSSYYEYGSRRVFNFDFIAGNMPIDVASAYRGLNAGITIVVSSGTLTSYRKLSINFTVSDILMTVNLDIYNFLRTLDADIYDTRITYRVPAVIGKQEYGKQIFLNIGLFDNAGRQLYNQNLTTNAMAPAF